MEEKLSIVYLEKKEKEMTGKIIGRREDLLLLLVNAIREDDSIKQLFEQSLAIAELMSNREVSTAN